ncbi:MAG TPA: hypothetical protein VL574_00510 [Stellaceae bacterium]|nr:hypothetical protein [Stellaceae bacterium]
MSITNVNPTPINSQGQGSKRGFVRVGSTQGTASFAPTTGTPSSSTANQTQQTPQSAGQQPKAFKGRGQFVNLLV